MAGTTAGATTCTTAPQATSPSTLRRATDPPPTTRHRRPSTIRFTGYWGPSTGTGGDQSSLRHRAGGSVVRNRTGRLLLVEAQDLELDGQVDLAQRHVPGHR